MKQQADGVSFFFFYLNKISCIFQLEHKSFVPYGFCSSFISFESEIQLLALPLGFARVAPAEFYSSATQCEKVLVSHKSSLRSFFTCTIFDFWRCKIKLSCKCALPLPFMLLQYRGVEKKNKDGKDWGKSEAFCHSTSPIPKQQRLTATTNTLEINYLWKRVRAPLIFSFYPIKLSNHSQPL